MNWYKVHDAHLMSTYNMFMWSNQRKYNYNMVKKNCHLWSDGLEVYIWLRFVNILGPVVQNDFSLTKSLRVKMLTALVSTISNSQVFLLKQCE